MKIVLLYGGNSLESDISEVTFKKVSSLLKESKYEVLGIFLNHEGEFFLNNKKGMFYKNKDTYYFKVGFKKYYFSYVLPLVHGKNSEDGTLGAFFDILKIPCIYSGVLNASILQDKAKFKDLGKTYNIPTAKYTYLTYSEYMNINIDLKELIKDFSYPLIVKPSSLGSSIGVKKVTTLEELILALDKAFSYDECVLIEECITSLKEVNIALLGDKEKQIVSLLETVSNKEDVLSYFDKYLTSKDKVTRIIPSDINDIQKEEIIKISKEAFIKYNCFGIIRFDYLINQKTNNIYLNEINTIPGSLAYYLFEPLSIKMSDIIDTLINLYNKKVNREKRLVTSYHQGDKNALLSKE